ncbi:hypothetical protein Godav_006602 [Gossypium davidsonii]|uniref:Uncharacterized protein n=1 Tax=Gossypium davidsonii TaxID=34287 RepID=A0A7J8S5R8_GOSDV|nr:hypothetical protein [Gossypium davidsonii]
MSIMEMTHPNTKKRVNLFALSIYGLVIFLKALGHIDDAVLNLLNRLDKRPFLVGRKGFLSNILRELLSVERIPGYAKGR